MNDPRNDPLHQAVRDRNTVKVEQLLAAGADANARDKDGWTPLLIACWGGSALIARLLLQYGASLHALGQLCALSEEEQRSFTYSGKGVSALRIAVWHGQVEVVRVLLDWEAVAAPIAGQTAATEDIAGHGLIPSA